MAQTREVIYKNKPFPSVSALANSLNIKRSTLSMGINNNPDLTIEEVVNKILGYDKPIIATINGKEYRTYQALSDDFDISVSVIKKRIKDGMSPEEACTTPTKKIKKPITYNGVKYSSISELMRAYGLDLATYNSRKQIGWTLDEIISTPIYGKAPGKAIPVSYKGKDYASLSQLADDYSIPRSTFMNRYNSGMTIQECLQDFMLDDNGDMIKYE